MKDSITFNITKTRVSFTERAFAYFPLGLAQTYAVSHVQASKLQLLAERQLESLQIPQAASPQCDFNSRAECSIIHEPAAQAKAPQNSNPCVRNVPLACEMRVNLQKLIPHQHKKILDHLIQYNCE